MQSMMHHAEIPMSQGHMTLPSLITTHDLQSVLHMSCAHEVWGAKTFVQQLILPVMDEDSKQHAVMRWEGQKRTCMQRSLEPVASQEAMKEKRPRR